MKRTFVYCGTWEASALPGAENDTGKGEGVYAFELDTSSGALIPVNLAYAKDAGVLAVSPDQKYLYGANESRDFGGIPASGGGVTAFSIDQKTGGVSRINDSIAYGACTAYVSVSKSGRYLLAANHGSHFDLACRYVPDGHFAVIGLMGSGRAGVYTVDKKSGRILKKVYETIVPNCCSIRFAELM